MAKGFLLAVVSIVLLSGILWIAYSYGYMVAQKLRRKKTNGTTKPEN